MVSIPKRIKERRLTLGLTAEQVAAKANMHPSTLSFLENERQEPSLRQLRRLSKALRDPSLRHPLDRYRAA